MFSEGTSEVRSEKTYKTRTPETEPYLQQEQRVDIQPGTDTLLMYLL